MMIWQHLQTALRSPRVEGEDAAYEFLYPMLSTKPYRKITPFEIARKMYSNPDSRASELTRG